MQSTDDDRLRLEVTLKNTTSSVQRYSTHDFRVVGQGGRSWPEISTAGQNTFVGQAAVEPNYSVTLAVYFDIPMKQNKGLSIAWARGGAKVDFPVNVSGAPMTPMNMR